jgi:hypothetical protein
VRLLRSYELGLEGHVVHVFAQAGRCAAIRFRAGDEDLVDMLENSLLRVIRPVLDRYGARIRRAHRPELTAQICGAAETKDPGAAAL